MKTEHGRGSEVREARTDPTHLYRITALAFVALLAAFAGSSRAGNGQNAQACFECHADRSLVSDARPGKSLFVDKSIYDHSAHAKLTCVQCHADADVADFPHPSKLKAVQCALCHATEAKEYAISRHAETAQKPDLPGATCTVCHGKHDILPAADARSPSNAMNIPKTCGKCHNEEGRVPMADGTMSDVSFTDAIHARGLRERGIKVTAVCTSCHGAHAVLRYSDQRSSISRENSAATCRKCHTNLEAIHTKVIQKGLWRARGTSFPVCVDCHDPHKGFEHALSRTGFSDRSCMKCHVDSAIASVKGGAWPHLVSGADLLGSAHKNVPCVQCHVDVSKNRSPVCAGSERVNCASCHSAVAESYQGGIHGVLHAQGDHDAPSCVGCHGDHAIQSKGADNSPIGRLNSPALCGRCHKAGKTAEKRNSKNSGMWEKYSDSVHGKGLQKSGLMVTAICVDCHTAHGERPGSDSASSVNKANIAATCAHCHQGILEALNRGVHSPLVTKTQKPLPVCSDCHPAHDIRQVSGNAFRQETMAQCGRCHTEVAKTYFETYHGKSSRLGSTRTAKCSDCHGAHEIYRPGDPRSPLSAANIVTTCKKCHPQSNNGFAGYRAHASHNNRAKYPLIFFTFWSMNCLLIGTMGFFGLHTLLWFPRSLRQRLREQKKSHAGPQQWVRRFSPFYRILHICVIISFLALALTGMIIKFSYEKWAIVLSQILGGTEVTRVIHRVAALITFGYFGFHIGEMIVRLRREKINIWDFLFLRESMIPTMRDVREFVQTVKWFWGKGPRPTYGKWTYWEKFDYFAVFWGVAIIGSTGLVLWFPEFFTRIFPGWIINIAMVIHSDEALLAVGFIFTIHFFNTHFRPEKFPMDTVIFSGKVPLDV
ncbi:MAG: cytochrome c3 family protein, partial [Chitinivibrionales bacterium]|nr:cytochrome c3 family protein [Chitinivibrionales bacterium]